MRSKQGLLWGMFEIIVVIALLIVFGILMSKYYLHSEDIRLDKYVNPDQRALDFEAQSIVVPPSNATAKNIFVLNYHSVTKWRPGDEYEISYDQFKESMFRLKREGYQTVTLDQLYRYMRGEIELPDKSFVLTFDDGARTAYYNSDPVLKALNYTAVMFVITGFSFEGNSTYYLNESELRAAQDTGRWQLESHTHLTHVRSPIGPRGEIGPALTNKLWLANERRMETDEEYYNRASNDIRTAKEMLESKFNRSIIAFALPFGDFGQRGKGSNYDRAHTILSDLTTSMHKMVFYQFSPSTEDQYRANYPDKFAESYIIVRLSADILRDSDDLMKEIEASRAKDLPYIEDYSNDQMWPRISGDATVANGSIIFTKNSDDGGTTILTYLDGSYLWRDYVYSLRPSQFDGESIMLIGRYSTSANYVGCEYTDQAVRLISAEGTSQVVGTTAHPQRIPVEGATLGIRVKGTSTACLINGAEVLVAETPTVPAYGGVALKAEGFDSVAKLMVIKNITSYPA